jgi:RNA polymerase sigma-70 factor (ECF subfamily)
VSDTPVQPEKPDDGATSPSLLDLARAKDRDAWRRLNELYAPLIYRWCHQGGLCEADAADVCQEVFSAVLAGLGSFKREKKGAFRCWLRSIARTKIADQFRRRPPGVAEGGSTAQERLAQVEAPTPSDPPQAAEDEETDTRLLYRRALDLIRRDFAEATWQAFWKVVVEGRPPKEVATELGQKRGTVDSAKYRVLNRLREEFRDLID